MPRTIALLAAVVGLVVSGIAPRPAAADWPPEGVPLCGLGVCNGRSPLVAPDGTGGAFVVWTDERNDAQSGIDIYAQRVTASGEIAAGWPADGFPVCTQAASQYLTAVAADGLGGVVITWFDYRHVVVGGTFVDVYAQRLLADGSLAPGWPADGAAVTQTLGNQNYPVVSADGTGGAFFSWHDDASLDIYLQRLTASGEASPGWPANGVPVCTEPNRQGRPQLAPDDAGGVIITWADHRDGPVGVYAQRVLADGSLAPGWLANGVRIVPGRFMRGLIPDGAGGAYLACATSGFFFDIGYYLQRFTTSGTIAPGWPASGIPVCEAPDDRGGLGMAPDGAGGALLVWSDYRDVSDDDLFALRIQPEGTRYPGWPLDGLRVTDNTALDDFPDLAPDGMGGAYLTWDQYTNALGDRVVVQHLTGDGTVAPGWPAGGREIPSDISSGEMRMVEDGLGGAIVAWHRSDFTIRALRYGTDGPVAVAVSLVSAEAEPGLVRLTWFAADGASLLATVERRTETSDWQRLAEVTGDGTGRLVYQDRAVTPGTRYAYRLSYPDGGTVAYTAETWVTVPAHRFALRGLTPNPSFGDPVVAFSLVSGEPAALELYDLHGRLVLSREVGSLGAGTQSVQLAARGRLPAGVYTVRLRQGEQTAKARAVIIR